MNVEIIVDRMIEEHQQVCEAIMYYAKTPISTNYRKSFIDALKHIGFYHSATALKDFLEANGISFYTFEKNNAWSYKVYNDNEVKLSGGFDMSKEAEYNALLPAFELITKQLKTKEDV